MNRNDYKDLYWTKEYVTKFWNYESQFPERYFTYAAGAGIAKWIKDTFPGKSTILDYGCGLGFLSEQLVEYGFEVYSYDVADDAVEKINSRLKGRSNFNGAYSDIQQLKEKNVVFDLVVCCEVIEHLYDDVLNSLIGDINSILGDNGIVIYTTPNDEDLEGLMLICPVSGERYHRWQHVRSWNQEGLKQYFESFYERISFFEENFEYKNKSIITKMVISSYVLLMKLLSNTSFYDRRVLNYFERSLIAVCKIKS